MTLALELRDVRSGYGRIEVLHGVSIEVPEGAVVALLGRNGMGKTTALRTIAGSIPATSGAILLNGRRIDGRRASTIASRGLVLVPEGRGVFPGLSVRENLQVAHRSGGAASGDWDSWLTSIVGRFPVLGERLDQTAGLLSGGEQQMLALCRALSGDPCVLMFDELSMGLAPIIVDRVVRQGGRTARRRPHHRAGRAVPHARAQVRRHLLRAGQRPVAWVGEPGELKNMPSGMAFLSA